jgi:hypothetical protein
MTKDSQTPPHQEQQHPPLIHQRFQPLHTRTTPIQMPQMTNDRSSMNTTLVSERRHQPPQSGAEKRAFLISILDDALALVEDSEDDFDEVIFSQ